MRRMWRFLPCQGPKPFSVSNPLFYILGFRYLIQFSPLTECDDTAQHCLFYLLQIYPGTKAEVCVHIFSNVEHSHRICTDLSFSAPHFLYEGVFVLLILCSIYCRLISPVRSPVSSLQCFLSTLLMNWTHLSVAVSWSRTFHRLSIPSFPFNVNTFLKSVSTLKSRVTYDLDTDRVTPAWLSVSIVIGFFTSLFLRQLVVQSSIAGIFAR